MKDKSKQIWSLYAKDIKTLKNGVYKLLSEIYLQLGQKPENEIVVMMTNSFTDDLATSYSTMELEEVKFALNKYIRENDPPIFVNIPTLNKALRDYRKTKALRKQTNQIEQYSLYKKRVESMGKALKNREIIKIGKGNSNKYKYE